MRILFHPTELRIAFSTILIYPFTVPLSVKYLEWTSEIYPNAAPANPMCIIKTGARGRKGQGVFSDGGETRRGAPHFVSTVSKVIAVSLMTD